MYLQFKHGFISTVRHEGAHGANQAVENEVKNAIGRGQRVDGNPTVFVVRSREERTLKWCVARLPKTGRPVVIKSPPNWDYEWRCYMSVSEWSGTLVAIAQDLDYSNFKNYCHDHGAPGQVALAFDTWHAVVNAAKRSRNAILRNEPEYVTPPTNKSARKISIKKSTERG